MSGNDIASFYSTAPAGRGNLPSTHGMLQAMQQSAGIAIGSPVSPAFFHWRLDRNCDSPNCPYRHEPPALIVSRWYYFVLRILWIHKKWQRLVLLSLWREELGENYFIILLQWYELRRLSVRSFLMNLGPHDQLLLKPSDTLVRLESSPGFASF